MSFELPADYVDVAERIREFRTRYPDGTLQRVDWDVREIDGKSFVVYTAAAYRTPDDPRPGIGTAWEPFPGRTPYTRDSELMNAETSAWGRAIIAAGAADAKRVASADEVRNRAADRTSKPKPPKRSSAPLRAVPDKGQNVAQLVADAFPDDGDVFRVDFGKHNGSLVTDIPENYMKWWLSSATDVKPGKEAEHARRRAAFEAELERRGGAVG